MGLKFSASQSVRTIAGTSKTESFGISAPRHCGTTRTTKQSLTFTRTGSKRGFWTAPRVFLDKTTLLVTTLLFLWRSRISKA